MIPGRLSPGEMFPAGRPGLRDRIIRVAPGIRVRVVEAGPENGPPVIMVPGWGCGAWMFHDTLPGLGAAGFHAIAVELKGHGLSDKPVAPDEYTVESMRDHLLDIVDALAVGRAGLLGHSMGASIAAHAAAAAEGRFTALALVAPVGFAGVRGMSVFRALTPAFAIRILPRITSRLLIWFLLIVVYRMRRPTGRDIDEFRAPTQFPEFTEALRHLLHRFEWKTSFPSLSLPRLVIVGTRDHLSRPKDAWRYADDTPPLVIRGAGHPILDEAPEIVNRALAEFFGRHAAEREPASPPLYLDGA